MQKRTPELPADMNDVYMSGACEDGVVGLFDHSAQFRDACGDEFDPNVDNPHNPRAGVHMLQSAGCMTLVAALGIATIIAGCYHVFNKDKEQPKAEQKEEPKKINSFLQRTDFTYTQKLREYGE